MWEEETDRFRAQSDDRTIYTVIELTIMIPINSIAEPPTAAKGSRRYVLSDGTTDVNRLDDGTFQIVGTEQILRKI